MAKPRPLLDRLLNAPDLARIVPQLQPEVVHRVIQTCGLEDCAELVALATPAQLARIVDLDVWHARTAGADEDFDADRFGLWIAVLLQAGPAVAVEKLLGLDIDLVIGGLARHVAVFDYAAVLSYTKLDGEHVAGRAENDRLTCEIGGYLLEAKRTSAWESLIDLFALLQAEQSEYFHRLMGGCIRLSSEPPEEDGFHDLLGKSEQHIFDLAAGREARRGGLGYVTPAQGQAFLRAARDLQLDTARPARSPIALAYFRAIDPAVTVEPGKPHATADVAGESAGEAPGEPVSWPVAGVVEILRDAGVLTPEPRNLLPASQGQPSRAAFVPVHVESHPASAGELAYLANTLVAACTIDERPFTLREASDAVVAACNLGLENWPPHWSDPDLVTAFQVGWTILHRDVCLFAAEHLIRVLGDVACEDRSIQLRLHGLRHALKQHAASREPWRARKALDVIIMLDSRSWAALRALIDECPVIHAALSDRRRPTVNPSEFEFVSENRQIAAVREFFASLPSVLTG